MSFTRLFLGLGAGWMLGLMAPSAAQNVPEPFTFDKAFSAEQIITMRDGTTVKSKFYSDNGRIRTDMMVNGLNMVSIVLPGQQKVYSILADQKMVMAMRYDPRKYGKYLIGTPAFEGSIQRLGPNTVAGVVCDKYKVTSKDTGYFLWVDPAKKQPVKIMAQDGSFTALWKNYQPGPQPASLFEIPSGYTMMDMSSLPGMPTGGP